MITITRSGYKSRLEISDDVFVKIVHVARRQLENLKRSEGYLVGSDAKALQECVEIEYAVSALGPMGRTPP